MDIFSKIEDIYRLKSLKRAGWIRAGIDDVESVAAHSWGVAWLVLLLCPSEIDLHRALALALVHDIAEVKVGDITPYDGIDSGEKAKLEREAFIKLVKSFPRSADLIDFFLEYQEGHTAESAFVHWCDKLDMMLQAELYSAENPDKRFQEFIDSALNSMKKWATNRS